METYDAPNQQVVRDDGSAPWEEGTGGPDGAGGPKTATATADTGSPLDAMTKEELLAEAQRLGVTPANEGMTKAELRAGIEAAA